MVAHGRHRYLHFSVDFHLEKWYVNVIILEMCLLVIHECNCSEDLCEKKIQKQYFIFKEKNFLF